MHPLFAAVLQGDFGVHSNHFIARINGDNFAAGIGFVHGPKISPDSINLAKKFPTWMLFLWHAAGIL